MTDDRVMRAWLGCYGYPAQRGAGVYARSPHYDCKEMGMRIAIGAGHSQNCDGATGHGYSENHEARLICDAFERLANAWDVPCVRCDSSASTQAGYLTEQGREFNAARADVCLQVHLNSGGGTGCEVWYRSAPEPLAARMSANMADVLGLRDRGSKRSTSLYILNTVSAPVYIVEVCFIDRLADIEALQGKHEDVARALLVAILGEDMDMQLSDKLNDKLLPDGSYNNVANVLNWTRINSDEILEKLAAITAELDSISKRMDELERGSVEADAILDAMAERLRE